MVRSDRAGKAVIAAALALSTLAATHAQETKQPPKPQPKQASVTALSMEPGSYRWRGPHQNGTHDEVGLPDKVSLEPDSLLWSYDLPGRGAPVILGNRLYTLGYRGMTNDLREVIACFDTDTGKLLWEHRFADFLSDIIYNRYSIGAPVIDPATGNVFMQTSNGVLAGFSPEGKMLWQRSLMEEFGRGTFPNGRTGAPIIEGDLVIVHGLTSNWGAQGAPADRFYAFDIRTGEHVWASQPGTSPPKDSSMSTPIVVSRDGKRVLICGTGCGHVVALNARTGEPMWRYPMSLGGVNASVVTHTGPDGKLKVIATHEDENLDSSAKGRTLAINFDGPLTADELKTLGRRPDGKPLDFKDPPAPPAPGGAPASTTAPATQASAAPASQPSTQPAAPPGPKVYSLAAEVWRNDVKALSSSPVLVGDTLYMTNREGELTAIDANNGRLLWQHKLGPEQLHASPLYADGKLYIPTYNGEFFVVRPTPKGAEVLSHVKLEDMSLGAPAVYRGRVYVQTIKRLYCFGPKEAIPAVTWKSNAPWEEETPNLGAPFGWTESLQIIPSEVTLRPGDSAKMRLRFLDKGGAKVLEWSGSDGNVKSVMWKSFIPPTALVKSTLDAKFETPFEMSAAKDAKRSAGAFQVTVPLDGDRKLTATMRGRIVPDLPYTEDFESFEINETQAKDNNVKFAYPPLTWIGGRFRWEVRAAPDDANNKVLTKTLDTPILQRAMTFIGHADMHDYTIEADVMTDGNRRAMSNIGLINQRYMIQLVGNAQQLEVSSNAERLKVGVPFKIEPKVWYHLVTRVDPGAKPEDRIVRAKAWKRGEPEPKEWTIEVPHADGHQHGSPGFWGFAPQSLFRVYLDNLKVTANKQ